MLFFSQVPPPIPPRRFETQGRTLSVRSFCEVYPSNPITSVQSSHGSRHVILPLLETSLSTTEPSRVISSNNHHLVSSNTNRDQETKPANQMSSRTNQVMPSQVAFSAKTTASLRSLDSIWRLRYFMKNLGSWNRYDFKGATRTPSSRA